MRRMYLPVCIILVLTSCLGCLSNHEQNFTPLEIKPKADQIAKKWSNNSYMYRILCEDIDSEGKSSIITYFYYSKDNTIYGKHYLMVEKKNGKWSYNSDFRLDDKNPLEDRIDEFSIDSDEAYIIGENNNEIQRFKSLGGEYGVDIISMDLQNVSGKERWQLSYEYQTGYDEPGNVAYISIDANSGEIIKVIADGVD